MQTTWLTRIRLCCLGLESEEGLHDFYHSRVTERSGIDQMQLTRKHLGRRVSGQALTQGPAVRGLFAKQGISAWTLHPLIERSLVMALCFDCMSNSFSLQKQLVRRVDRRCGSSRDAPSPTGQCGKGRRAGWNTPSPLPLFHA